MEYLPIPMPYDCRSEFKDRKTYPNYKESRRSKEIETYIIEYQIKKLVLFDDLTLIYFPDIFIQIELRALSIAMLFPSKIAPIE